MRFPEFIKKGGRAGFIAPSFGAASDPYDRWFDLALAEFEERGYRTVTGPNCRADLGLGKSNTAAKCAAEINEFFTGDRCDLIVSVGGGETMCEDLTYVDFDAIAAAKPLWYAGYSDNTNLTFTLPVLCDTAASYGPCACAFAMKPAHRSIEDMWSLFSGANVTDGCLTLSGYDGWEGPDDGTHESERPVFNITREPCAAAALLCSEEELASGGIAYTQSAGFRGRLIGGCLDVLRNLAGTRFDAVAGFNNRYGYEGVVWFLEACDFSSVETRRALWQLRNAGWFDAASGFIIGRPLQFDDCAFGMSQREAVAAALAGLDVPVIFDADLGHLPPAMPMISGAYCDARFEGGRLTLKQYLR